MADGYSITIDINDADTQKFLLDKSLRVFKSVGSDSTGLPVVWFSANNFGNSVTFSWSEQYAGYVQQGGNPAPGVTILDSSFSPMDLGQELMTAADGSGTVSLSSNGTKGAISVMNQAARDWTCGMGQMVQGSLSPICAFDLGGAGELVAMEPYEKVLLVFESTKQMDTGTVIAEATSGSLTVELDGDNPSRNVVFRSLQGWVVGPNDTWAVKNPTNFNLLPSLSAPSSAAVRAEAQARRQAARRLFRRA